MTEEYMVPFLFNEKVFDYGCKAVAENNWKDIRTMFYFDAPTGAALLDEFVDELPLEFCCEVALHHYVGRGRRLRFDDHRLFHHNRAECGKRYGKHIDHAAVVPQRYDYGYSGNHRQSRQNSVQNHNLFRGTVRRAVLYEGRVLSLHKHGNPC